MRNGSATAVLRALLSLVPVAGRPAPSDQSLFTHRHATPENRASVSSGLEKLALWPACELLVALEWGTNGGLIATLFLEGRFIQNFTTLTGPRWHFQNIYRVDCSQKPQLSEKAIQRVNLG